MKEKFEVKELINVGVFTALYFVVVFVTCFIGMVPICMVLIPLIIPIVAGIPLMLFFSKIRRFGMFTISGVLFGLITFLLGSYSWVVILTCVVSAFLAHMKQVAGEILKLRDMGKTVFIVTHDLEFILSCCDHIVRLEQGQAVENYELNRDTGFRLCQFFTNES